MDTRLRLYMVVPARPRDIETTRWPPASTRTSVVPARPRDIETIGEVPKCPVTVVVPARPRDIETRASQCMEWTALVVPARPRDIETSGPAVAASNRGVVPARPRDIETSCGKPLYASLSGSSSAPAIGDSALKAPQYRSESNQRNHRVMVLSLPTGRGSNTACPAWRAYQAQVECESFTGQLSLGRPACCNSQRPRVPTLFSRLSRARSRSARP